MACDHQKWVYPEPYLDDYCFEEHWIHPEPYQVSTTEDIDTGRYRCTQCGKVMYYTGLWREHWEGGRQLLDERTGNAKPKPAGGVKPCPHCDAPPGVAHSSSCPAGVKGPEHG